MVFLNEVKLLVAWIVIGLVTASAFSRPVAAMDDHPADDRNAAMLAAPSVLSGPIRAAIPPRLQPTSPPNQELDAKQVRTSITRGVQFLKDAQRNGHWTKMKDPGDTTALCALALINSGEKVDSPPIRDALAHIKALPAFGTYFVSLRIMALTAADPEGKVYFLNVKSDVEWLLKQQVNTGQNRGGWSYGARFNPSGGADGSNTQFALLALHEASRIGVRVPMIHWKMAKEYWENSNQADGGFSYYVKIRDSNSRGSMTCAGISSWIIIHENLADVKNSINGDFAKCCEADPTMLQVDEAFNWLTNRYSVRSHPGAMPGGSTTLYYLYGMERACRLAGRRFIGANDWYRDGAKQLMEWQNRLTGSWQAAKNYGEGNPVIATSFALLFLSKGKRPVAVGKFDHGVNDWDLHPKGVHFLTRRLESEWGQKLNWQTVRAENSTVDDLLEAPVLFMSGRDAIGLNQAQKDNLKKYLENGGFLFAEACQGDGCGDSGKYQQAFVELMAEIFPDSKLETLPIEHPIWNAHYPLLGNAVHAERPLLGLQACCRTSVVYCPTNLSCYWSLDKPAVLDDVTVSNKLKSRVEYCAQLGVNVVAYATGRQLKDKIDRPTLNEVKYELLAGRALEFPKLRHPGGADDAPNAWRNALRNLEGLGLPMKNEKKLISPNIDELADYPFVFMHGRGRFKFDPEQRQAIRDYLDAGGFIFADSICKSEEFTNSFKAEMLAILGQPLSPIAANHEIWTDERFGYRIDRVKLRIKDANAEGGFREQMVPPELLGTEIDGRLAVVFSPNDLSCALENTQVSQCTGYTRDDASKICTNVILYSLLSEVKQQ